MPTVVRDKPPGHDWSWFSREDQRMHVQSVDRQHDYKVWLESGGTRVFEPVGKIPSKVLKTLRDAVAERRVKIEDNWVDLMLDRGWLELHVSLPQITLIAYPRVPGKFIRKVDLSEWFTAEQLATLKPESIVLSREMARLRIWPERREPQLSRAVRTTTRRSLREELERDAAMGKLKTQRGNGTGRAKGSSSAMPAIIRNVPPGYLWGWYSREEPRMHLQTLKEAPSHKVWLEAKGKRVIEPVDAVPARLLRPLTQFLAKQRMPVEDLWVRFMLDNGWLQLHVALPHVTLVAYPSTSGKLVRKINLAEWLRPDQLATLTPDIIELNHEMASLRLWTDRPDEQAYDARLSKLLWTD